jgi:hypothetical protein
MYSRILRPSAARARYAVGSGQVAKRRQERGPDVHAVRERDVEAGVFAGADAAEVGLQLPGGIRLVTWTILAVIN